MIPIATYEIAREAEASSAPVPRSRGFGPAGPSFRGGLVLVAGAPPNGFLLSPTRERGGAPA